MLSNWGLFFKYIFLIYFMANRLKCYLSRGKKLFTGCYINNGHVFKWINYKKWYYVGLVGVARYFNLKLGVVDSSFRNRKNHNWET